MTFVEILRCTFRCEQSVSLRCHAQYPTADLEEPILPPLWALDLASGSHLGEVRFFTLHRAETRQKRVKGLGHDANQTQSM